MYTSSVTAVVTVFTERLVSLLLFEKRSAVKLCVRLLRLKALTSVQQAWHENMFVMQVEQFLAWALASLQQRAPWLQPTWQKVAPLMFVLYLLRMGWKAALRRQASL